MKKRNTILIIICFVLVLVIFASFIKKSNITKNNSSDSKAYDTYTLKNESPISLEGKASPKLIKTYNNTQEFGDYINTNVKHGQEVKQGDKIINYDIDDTKRQKLSNALNEAQNQVNNIYKQINENPNNDKLQSILTEKESSLSDAQNQLSKYDQKISDSVYASFNGTINIDNDSKSNNGEPILKLISDDKQIKSTVSEFDLSKIKEGNKVNISVNSSGKHGEGKILKIDELPTSYEESESSQPSNSSQSNEGTQSSNPVQNSPDINKEGTTSKYEIIIGDLNIPVNTGLSMDANIPLDTLKLPQNTLTKDNNVFTLDSNNKVHKQKILIEKNNGQIFVKKGLKKGDKVLKNPKKTLNDRDKVEVSS